MITPLASPVPMAHPSIGTAADAGELIGSVDHRTRELIHRRSGARRRVLVRRTLAASDLIGLTLALGLAIRGRLPLDTQLAIFAVALPGWIVAATLRGLYDRDETRADNPTADDIGGVFQLITVMAWLLIAGALLAGVKLPEASALLATWALAIVFVPVARTVGRGLARRSPAYVQNTLIVGAGDVGQLVARKLIRHPEYGLNVVGFVDSWPKARREDLPDHLSILGKPERLREVIDALKVERVVVSFCNDPATETLEVVRMIRDLDVQVDVVPQLFDLVGPQVSVHDVEGLALVGLPPCRPTGVSRLLKRTIDVVVSGLALLALAPVFAFIAWRIRRDSPGGVFFRQTRLGHYRKEFTALKFRTMKVDVDTSVHQAYIKATMDASAAGNTTGNGIYKLDRGDAITGVGRWLRKTSLDELPQLINVLRGEMSLVGPRPCIPYEIDHFKPHQFARFDMPQGITGLWQVTARAHASFGEALDMDVAYVRGWSLGLDLRLLLRTPLQLLRQRAATA